MSALYILILIMLAAVVIVLSIGIGRFGREGAKNAQRSNKMMQLRILLQAIAVMLILLFIFLGRGGS